MERKVQRIVPGICGILPCIFLIPFFLLFFVFTVIRSLLDWVTGKLEKKFANYQRRDDL